MQAAQHLAVGATLRAHVHTAAARNAATRTTAACTTAARATRIGDESTQRRTKRVGTRKATEGSPHRTDCLGTESAVSSVSLPQSFYTRAALRGAALRHAPPEQPPRESRNAGLSP